MSTRKRYAVHGYLGDMDVPGPAVSKAPRRENDPAISGNGDLNGSN